MPFATRGVLRRQLGRLAERGFDFVTGLEVEFHLTRLLDPRGAGPAAPTLFASTVARGVQRCRFRRTSFA